MSQYPPLNAKGYEFYDNNKVWEDKSMLLLEPNPIKLLTISFNLSNVFLGTPTSFSYIYAFLYPTVVARPLIST